MQGDQIQLENVLTALANPIRLTVARTLAAGGEHPCGTLLTGISSSTLTHHWRVLRDSGVIWQRPSGRENASTLTDHEERYVDGLDSPTARSSLRDGTACWTARSGGGGCGCRLGAGEHQPSPPAFFSHQDAGESVGEGFGRA